MPKFFTHDEYIQIPSKFIEEYMPKANAAFVKVYLYAKNLASHMREESYLDIAKALNLLESDVAQAFEYWIAEGVLRVDGNDISFNNIGAGGTTAETVGAKTLREPVRYDAARPGYTMGEVAGAIKENAVLSEMVGLAQEILGKTLNATDTETLFWFYDGLKFSPEVILMLLEYCVSKEKRRMNYVEKVAVSWHERGITSPSAVSDFIQKEAEHTNFLYSIRKVLGITDRALTQSEEQYMTRWHDMYKMEEEMISLAYEQCIIQTAKLSYPYMEKILERWYKQGIHTVAQAEEDNKKFRSGTYAQPSNAANAYDVFSADNYDHNALEQLTRKK